MKRCVRDVMAARVIGVVSGADLLAKEAGLATGHGPLASVLRFGDQEKAAGVTAAELMTSPPLTVSPDTGATCWASSPARMPPSGGKPPKR